MFRHAAKGFRYCVQAKAKLGCGRCDGFRYFPGFIRV